MDAQNVAFWSLYMSATIDGIAYLLSYKVDACKHSGGGYYLTKNAGDICSVML